MAPQLIGFIGAGNMARSLAGGLLNSGWRAQDLILSDPDPQQREALHQALGVEVVADNAEVAERAEVLVLAVKPQILPDVARALAPVLRERRPLIISIAAGVRIRDLARWIGGELPIVRVMPNTPALVGSGASGLFAGETVSAAQRDTAESVLRAVGVAVWVQNEDLMDVITAVSGSGPAYVFLFLEAMAKSAQGHGLDAATARLLALETVFGAAKMALESSDDPALLRARVTSPGGTTERAIAKFEQENFAQLIDQAITAAKTRAAELADILGKK